MLMKVDVVINKLGVSIFFEKMAFKSHSTFGCVAVVRGQICGFQRFFFLFFRFILGLLGGGFKYFLFSLLLGEDSHFDEHIFQMGWFNHQLV